MRSFAALVLAMTISTRPPAHAQHVPDGGERGGHGHGHGAHGKHGNPADLAAYVAKLDDPSRDAWQKPDEVIGALALKRGQTVCDIGAGSGYFSLRAARAVGERGHVFAVDVEPAILDVLRERVVKSGARNVTPVLALPDHPLVPAGSCDVVLVVNTFHHFPDGVAYLRTLGAALRPGGRLVNIDFHRRELPVGPPVAHKVAREDFISAARHAGLRLDGEFMMLPHQYFLVMVPARASRPARPHR